MISIVISKSGISIDYSIAREYAAPVRAFAIIESQENPTVIGDSGQAFGLLQIHPTTFRQYYGAAPKYFPLNNADTWTIAELKTCASFLMLQGWDSANQDTRDLIVQAWNLGAYGVFGEGKRNPEYLARWLAAYDKVNGLAN